MLDQAGLQAAINAYEETTRDAVRAARELSVPKPTCVSFKTGTLSPVSIDSLLLHVPRLARGEGKRKHKGYLYIYRLGAACALDSSIVTAAMLEAKNRSKDGDQGKLPAVNEEHASRVLYVGRSWKIASRTREHLKADCSKKTYALRLEAWAKEFDFEVELFIWEFLGVSDLALQVVEDGLWDRLQPLLGRRGAK